MSGPDSPFRDPALAPFAVLAGRARRLERPAGAALFRAGERPAWMYYVEQGEAQMLRVTAAGSPVILQRASRGFLAEASLTSPRYHCDAVCRTDCVLAAFPVRALREAIDRDPGVRWAWIDLLSAQSRRQRARIERMALTTVRERLAHLVLTEGDGRGAYRLPGTRAELASELGVTPEALYRTLAAMQAEGALAVRGAHLRWRR